MQDAGRESTDDANEHPPPGSLEERLQRIESLVDRLCLLRRLGVPGCPEVIEEVKEILADAQEECLVLAGRSGGDGAGFEA